MRLGAGELLPPPNLFEMRATKRLRLLAGFAAMLAVAAMAVPAQALPPLVGGAFASANVDWLGRLPEPGAVGARFIGDTMYVTTSGGLRIYDASSAIPVLVGALTLPHWENEDVDTNGSILLIAADHGFAPSVLYVVDVSNPALPVLLSAPTPVPSAHTASCINNCSFAWMAGRSAVDVMDLSNPAAPLFVGSFFPGGQIHDVQVDDAGIAWVSSSRGLFGYRTDDAAHPQLVVANRVNTPGGFQNDFIIHNSLRPNAVQESNSTFRDSVIDSGEKVLVTEENWLSTDNGECNRDGRFQTGWYHSDANGPRVDRLDSFNLGRGTVSTAQKPTGLTCSSHYLDYRDSVAAVAWYEQGVRFLDVSDPRNIRQVGYWMPASSQAWSVVFHRDQVYVIDAERGIDVLSFSGQAGGPTVLASRYGVAAKPAVADPRFGFSCRLI